MTQDEIVRMAREAGISSVWAEASTRQLERFAALVAAHERNRHAWTQEHWTEYEHAIAAAEREACCSGDVVNAADIGGADHPHQVVAKYQAAIRARGDK